MGSDAAPAFFVLTSQRGSPHDTELSTVEDQERGDAPTCPACGGFIGMRTWRAPHRVELKLLGDAPGDFIPSSGVGSDVIISERFADAFRAAGLTGLKGFEPVEVLRVRPAKGASKGKDTPLPRYLAVTATFGSARVDEAHSHILRPGPFTCDTCRAVGTDGINGFTLEPESWNGDDVFEPRGLPGVRVVSERFARLVTEHGLTHVSLTPTERYVWDPLRRFTQATGG
ncbi:hypothetical protein LXT21_33590 [Myxococcus sp. K38C18041901]|uniref:hypothetical protein n=1 Tax=Myxococcus guangdongensis TaxID=2906760 RepID=UPI0020A800FA|nr:hypothetical protein [Myxococcus guangdongensis]MCP3063719.1 hypothetical protein [Myxococcus guangdongensis]